ncbi:MAG: 6-phospho-beta-glucosidase [Pseudonocardiales bacterium]|nr:MAG: 6-phospho-beta-glucosidase [Pseudonocardiales bacterium]
MRLSILGGGGFRIPLIYRALLDDPDRHRIDEIVLYDVAADRLDVIESVLAAMAESAGPAPSVPSLVRARALEEAVTGADFVFSAVRVGGLAGRIHDERVALELGVLGQETTGPGGLAYGLRTIPVAMRIAHAVRTFAPHAWVLNFTNPAGMITQAMQRVLGDRVIGICDAPESMVLRIAAATGHRGRLDADYVGLNHLGWLRGLRVDGTDVLPAVLGDDRVLGELEEGQIFGPDWLRALGCIPNEYLYYYDFTREAIAAILAAGMTRGEYLLRQQGDFYAAAQAAPGEALSLWQHAVDARQSTYMAEARAAAKPRPELPDVGGYERVALGVMSAISSDAGATMILNVRNDAAVDGLPADAVVEVASTVDAKGAHPQDVGAPAGYQLGLMQQVKAVEGMTIEAADSGSRDDAWRAFAAHPLVDSVAIARRLVVGYLG